MAIINKTNTHKRLQNSATTNYPDKLVIHHSGGTDVNPLEDTSHHTAEMIESWHISKGWDGLGYQYVIHKNGDIWAGRPEHIQGAHTLGQNSQSIGVCLSGNFDATLPTKEQIESFKIFYKDLIKRYPHITPDKVYPHRKFANKTCYGKKLSDTWASELAKSAIEAKGEVKDGTPECEAMIKKERGTLIDRIIQFLLSLK